MRATLEQTEEFLIGISEKLSTLNPNANPTEVVGLAVGLITGYGTALFHIAHSLRGIENALAASAGSLAAIEDTQRALVAIANADLEQYVKQSVEKHLDEAVQAATTKRNPIGRTLTD